MWGVGVEMVGIMAAGITHFALVHAISLLPQHQGDVLQRIPVRVQQHPAPRQFTSSILVYRTMIVCISIALACFCISTVAIRVACVDFNCAVIVRQPAQPNAAAPARYGQGVAEVNCDMT